MNKADKQRYPQSSIRTASKIKGMRIKHANAQNDAVSAVYIGIMLAGGSRISRSSGFVSVFNHPNQEGNGQSLKRAGNSQ